MKVKCWTWSRQDKIAIDRLTCVTSRRIFATRSHLGLSNLILDKLLYTSENKQHLRVIDDRDTQDMREREREQREIPWRSPWRRQRGRSSCCVHGRGGTQWSTPEDANIIKLVCVVSINLKKIFCRVFSFLKKEGTKSFRFLQFSRLWT